MPYNKYSNMILSYLSIALYIFVLLFVGYDLLFALFSFLYKEKRPKSNESEQRFLVLFPAYKEDEVIIDSVTEFLKQDYPQEKYTVCVISDHMKDETNLKLESLPIRLIKVNFEVSLKSKAINEALQQSEGYDKVIIMDADNVTTSDFLTRVNQRSIHTEALQLHRKWKNTHTSVATWDAIAEEINNSIYRKGHVVTGLSSALIGSGMVFNFEWLKKHMHECKTFAEDRELEVILVRNKIRVEYAHEIHVYDEKTSFRDVLLKQRTRWTHAQFIAFKLILPLIRFDRHYLDKVIQWFPFPKQIRIVVILTIMFIFCFISLEFAFYWFLLFIIQLTALSLAVPKRMYNKQLLIHLTKLPGLVFLLVKSYISSFYRMKHKDMSFSNTPHHTTTSQDIKKEI